MFCCHNVHFFSLCLIGSNIMRKINDVSLITSKKILAAKQATLLTNNVVLTMNMTSFPPPPGRQGYVWYEEAMPRLVGDGATWFTSVLAGS